MPTIRSIFNRTLNAFTGYEVHKPVCPELPWFEKWLPSLGINSVIDVGAHAGAFTDFMLPLLPSASFHLFEPLPDYAQHLQSRFVGDSRFAVYCTACGDSRGQVEFYRSKAAPSSSMLVMTDRHKSYFPHTSQNLAVTVPVVPLDDVDWIMPLTPNVFLKLDVQGYENRVLAGANKLLQSTRVVMTEVQFHLFYEKQAEFHDLASILFRHSFRFCGLINLNFSANGEPLFADAIFSRSTDYI